VLFLRLLRVKHWETALVAAPFYFGFPVLLYNLFNNLALDCGIAAVVAILALYAAERLGTVWFVAASLLVAVSISFYQSFLFFAFVAFAGRCVSKVWFEGQGLSAGQGVKYCTRHLCIVISGLVLYILIALLFLFFLGEHLTYLGNYYYPNMLINSPVLVIKRTVHEMWQLYSGSAPSFVGKNLYYRILLVSCAGALLFHIASQARSRPGAARILAVLLMAILISPFLQLPLSRGSMPYRALVSLPLAVAIIALVSTETSSQKLRRWLLAPLAALLIIEFSVVNNRQYYAGHWALQRDTIIGAQIIEDIRKIAPLDGRYTIALVGSGPVYDDEIVPLIPDSTVGASFFAWDGGNAIRVANFLRFLSDAKFTPAPREKQCAAFEDARGMPSWPAPGFVAQRGNTFIIKLSEPTQQQLDFLSCLAPAGEHISGATTFGSWAALESYSYQRTGDGIALSLRWRAIQPLNPDILVAVHLIDEKGNILKQYDYSRAKGIPAGQTVIETVIIPHSELDATRHKLAIALYTKDGAVAPVDQGARDWDGHRLLLSPPH
jgi:hypothetical protein